MYIDIDMLEECDWHSLDNPQPIHESNLGHVMDNVCPIGDSKVKVKRKAILQKQNRMHNLKWVFVQRKISIK